MVARFRTGTCAAALALATLAAPPVLYADHVPVLWRCWYESEGVYRIRCLPRALAGPLSPSAEDWENVVDIPIYTPPIGGTERSERLARAVLCGRNPACRIVFGQGHASAATPH